MDDTHSSTPTQTQTSTRPWAWSPAPTRLAETSTPTPVDYDMDDGYFDAVLGAVIGTVVMVFLCLVVVVIRYMFRHKGTYRTNEAKGTEFAETADAALRRDPALRDAMDETKTEYFI